MTSGVPRPSTSAIPPIACEATPATVHPSQRLGVAQSSSSSDRSSFLGLLELVQDPTETLVARQRHRHPPRRGPCSAVGSAPGQRHSRPRVPAPATVVISTMAPRARGTSRARRWSGSAHEQRRRRRSRTRSRAARARLRQHPAPRHLRARARTGRSAGPEIHVDAVVGCSRPSGRSAHCRWLESEPSSAKSRPSSRRPALSATTSVNASAVMARPLAIRRPSLTSWAVPSRSTRNRARMGFRRRVVAELADEHAACRVDDHVVDLVRGELREVGGLDHRTVLLPAKQPPIAHRHDDIRPWGSIPARRVPRPSRRHAPSGH